MSNRAKWWGRPGGDDDPARPRSWLLEDDGIRVREPGQEIAKPAGMGFIEIAAANGHAAIARCTPAAIFSASTTVWMAAIR
jgi:hypothetical protein